MSNQFYPQKFYFENFIFPKFCPILFFFYFLKNLVMNNVHEQCPKSDSKTVLSPKTGWVHQVLSLLAQPTHPGAHRHAQARARGCVAAVLWALPVPCRSARATVSQAQGVVSQSVGGLVVAECCSCQRRVVAWPPDRVATQCLPQLPCWS